ncbi:MAG: hypothetical protein QXF48_01985 [Candidatus Anstonellaceae archaeon]
MALFGTSGIRDICPRNLDIGSAFELGQTAAKFSKKIVVGYDGRPTGQMLLNALIAGITQQKSNCLNIGICTTPTLCWYTKITKSLGIMITASHNPLEYNGFKIFQNGLEASAELEKKIEKSLKNTKKRPKYFEVGEIKIEDKQAIQRHFEILKRNFDFAKIKKENLKILIDCANLAASITSVSILEKFGITLIKKNCEIGKKPDRKIEPNEESLKNLTKIKEKFDFAIAHDGDADRAIILDQNANMIGLDVQLAIASEYFLKNFSEKKIVSTIESSLILKEVVKKYNAQLYLSAVGSRAVAQLMRKTSAPFGGEPCGEYIFKNSVGCPDGIATALLFCQIYINEGKLSKIKEKYKVYPIKRIKIKVEKEEKKIFMQKIEKLWPFSTKIKIDGLRAEEEWGWILVRPSGTEDYIRITIEAYKEKDLEENLERILQVIRDVIGRR